MYFQFYERYGKTDMKKIVCAGAGHGGLSAALLLAREGYDVTVLEAKSRKELGYDWHDCVWLPAFEDIGLVPDNPDFVYPFFHYTYHNPAETMAFSVTKGSLDRLRMVDRRYILNLLIDECKKTGVKFEFGKNITGAIIEGSKVAGVHTARKEYRADLVIDAAGIDSPVRKSLPPVSGVQKEISPDKIIWAYRAYYENRLNKPAPDYQNIYFFHCGKPGMDWLITEKDFVDVLVGSFSPLTKEDIDRAVADFQRIYSHMSDRILKGGTVQKIPIGKAIPKFVWNGYAAVGDSASMTEPMSGSGISRSLSAGKILAETVINIGKNELTQKNLWHYEYDYLKKHGESAYSDSILREFLATLKPEDLDYFFEHKIMTEKEIGGGKIRFSSPAEFLQKVTAFVPKAGLLPRMAGAVLKLRKAESVKSALPKEFSQNAYSCWLKLYSQL